MSDRVDYHRKEGAHKRLYWRVRHRVGPGWDQMSDADQQKLLRQFSWRRAL